MAWEKWFIDFLYDLLNFISNWRIKQPFYRTFLITWLLVNWKMIYFILFVDENILIAKNNITKFDYIIQNYSFSFSNFNLDLILFLKFFIIPWFFTWLFIWIFPKYITKSAFEKYSETIWEENVIKKRYEINQKKKEDELYLLDEKKKLEKEKINIDKEDLENKQVNKNKTIWDNEYNKFKLQKEIFSDFSDVINRINFHKWNMHFVFDGNRRIDDSIDFKTLSYLLSKDVLKQNSEWSSLYYFTTKWNYFKDRYIDEWNLRKFEIRDPNHINIEDIPF